MHPVLEGLARGEKVLLDGALGSELERRGIPTPAPLWSAAALESAPGIVGAIHAGHVAAGCRVLTANTFRTTPRAAARAGRSARDAADWTRQAMDLARRAAEAVRPDRPVAVAGAIAPLEDCYRHDLAPDAESAEREHGAQARLLADCGADLILIETMNTVREARAALSGARRAANLPVWVSLIPGPDLTLLDGTPLGEALQRVAADRPDAILVNCLPADYAVRCIPLLAATGLTWGIYANASRVPGAVFSASDEISPEAFTRHAATCLAAGACILGGCCGTTPAHMAALSPLISLEPGGNPVLE